MIAENRIRKLMLAFLTVSLSSCSGSPVCATASLQHPNLNSPADFSVVASLLPTLSWNYPDASCHPQGYRIDLSPDATFADTTLAGGTGNPSTNWSPGSNLQPGSEYFWKVAAINGTTLGPASSYRRFFTGPYCDPAALAAPTLVWPADGATVNTIMPGLQWTNGNPGCIPQGYGIHLSSDPTFADPTYNGGTGNPDQTWYPGHDLADCTTYYWLVFAGIDTTFGPNSTVRSFFTNASGTCAALAEPPLPTATAVSSPTPVPTAVFTPTIIATATSASFFKALVKPNHIYYRGTGCGEHQAQFQVQVGDPNKVAGVWLFVRLQNNKGDGITGWSEALVMTPMGSGWFSYMLMAESIPNFTKFADSLVQYQFVAYDKSFGRVAASDVFFDVELSACGK